MQDLLAVILCGGESKRMGSDKGLLPTEGTVWARNVAGKLSFLDIPVIFSINASQVEKYSAHIPENQLIIDSVDVSGPLKGLLSVHQQYPQRNLLLLACDMLDLDKPTIEHIIEVYVNDKGYDFYVYQDTDYAQPFCGIYTAKGLVAVLEKAAAHSLEKFSLQQVLNNGNTKRLTIINSAAFKNYNEPH